MDGLHGTKSPRHAFDVNTISRGARLFARSRLKLSGAAKYEGWNVNRAERFTLGEEQAMPVTKYNSTSRALHWIIVALIIVQFSIAWTMPEVERGTSPVGLIAWHLSIGTTILAVMLVRLVWRLTHPAPPPPNDLSPALRLVSRSTHFVLYAVLIALPIGGWINASARGWPVTLFGAIPLPSLIAKGSALGLAAGDIHMAAATALLVIIGLHIAGSAYHAVVLKDDTVKRMV